MGQRSCGWWALRGCWGVGSTLSSDWSRKSIHFCFFSTLRWLLLTSALVIPLNCSHCVTGHSCIHWTFFWGTLRVKHHAAICWDKNEFDRQVHRQWLYNVIEVCRRGSRSSDWGWTVQKSSLTEGMCEGTTYFLASVKFAESSLLILRSSPRCLGFPWKVGLKWVSLATVGSSSAPVSTVQSHCLGGNFLAVQSYNPPFPGQSGAPLHHLRMTWGYFPFWICV